MSLFLDDYDYHLDAKKIAIYPPKDRTSAKLLVYNRKNKQITSTVFSKLFDYLPKDTAVIINDTKVIKARFFAKSPTKTYEILYLKESLPNVFLVQIKGRVKKGLNLEVLEQIFCEILELNTDGTRLVRFLQNGVILDKKKVLQTLDLIGHTPLPPYIKRADEKTDENDYSSVFAKIYGSVAAPTASLHFDEKMFEKLCQNYKVAKITLDVGLGTFSPIKTQDLRMHKIHKERYQLSDDAINLIQSSEKILCVGTTSLRAVEFFARTKLKNGDCDLFLHPQNPPIRADFLLTNFHLPKSSLIVLVASFLGLDETKRVYQYAIDNDFKFFSYGDCMLVL